MLRLRGKLKFGVHAKLILNDALLADHREITDMKIKKLIRETTA